MTFFAPMLLSALALTSSTNAGAASAINDPAAFVRAIYARYQTAKNANPPEGVYSRRLQSLLALDRKEAGKEVGRLDFDYVVGAQDYTLTDIKIAASGAQHGRQVVTATFKNMDQPSQIAWYFEHEGGRWVVDDVQSKKEPWTLSLMLKYGE